MARKFRHARTHNILETVCPVKEYLFGLRLADAVFVEALAFIAGVPLDTDQPVEVNHCRINIYGLRGTHRPLELPDE
ncbi:MAG: hypothetical protein ACT4NU_03120 [Chromatiales bacterium]